jgi:hypothetical protein
MKIVQGDAVEWRRALQHRGGTFHYRHLLDGTRATTGNFQFDIGQIEGDFASPRHRHNFDQFRSQLEGTMNFDRNGKMGLFLFGSGIAHDSEYRRWTAASRCGGGSRITAGDETEMLCLVLPDLTGLEARVPAQVEAAE